MEIRWTILLIIIGSAVVTFLPRVLPLMILSRLQLPNWLIRWLKHVPISVMAALLAQELLLSQGAFSPDENILKIGAALPAFAVAIWTKSLLGTVLVGIASMFVLRFFF